MVNHVLIEFFRYERVLSRVLDQSVEAERKAALKVLTLVVCAKRILYWREIQAVFCVDPEHGTVKLDDRLRVKCKELCGSLLDVDHAPTKPTGPDSTVRIVHSTARR
jgi:hypothetical protein